MPSIEAAYLAEAYIHSVLFACDSGPNLDAHEVVGISQTPMAVLVTC